MAIKSSTQLSKEIGQALVNRGLIVSSSQFVLSPNAMRQGVAINWDDASTADMFPWHTSDGAVGVGFLTNMANGFVVPVIIWMSNKDSALTPDRLEPNSAYFYPMISAESIGVSRSTPTLGSVFDGKRWIDPRTPYSESLDGGYGFTVSIPPSTVDSVTESMDSATVYGENNYIYNWTWNSDLTIHACTWVGFYEGGVIEQPVGSHEPLVYPYSLDFDYVIIPVDDGEIGPDPDPDPPEPEPGEWTTIQIWRGFSKRRKSTKRPSVAGESLNVLLKRDTSILNPVMELKRDYIDYNYMLWAGRYYYLETISMTNTSVIVRGTPDPLATYKTQIRSSNAYIERCAWSSQVKIADVSNPATEQVATAITTSASPVVASDAGTFLFYTASSDGMNLYHMTESEANKIFTELWAQSTITPEEASAIQNAILFVRRVPFPIGSFAGSGSQVVVANKVTTGIDTTKCIKVADPTTPININLGTLALNFPSASWYGGETYLDHNGYSTGMLYLPFVGVVSLDLDYFATMRSMKILAQIDKMTGDIVYSIRDVNDVLISTYNGNCSASVPISSNYFDQHGLNNAILTTLGGAVATVVGGITGNPMAILGGLGAIASGANSMSKSAEIHTMINGSQSSNLGFYIKGGYAIACIVTKVPVQTDLLANRSVVGLPYMQVGSLSNSGYVKTAGANINIPGVAWEKDEVNSLLDGGIYLE